MGNIHHQGLKLKLATHGSGVYGRSGSVPFSASRVFKCVRFSSQQRQVL